MHPKVTPNMIESYHDIGVAHVPGVFDADWIGRMTHLIDRTIAGLRAGTLKFGSNAMFEGMEFEDHDGYVRLIKLFWHLPEMRALIAENDCAAVVADVIGSDDMRPWLDGTFMKEGGAPETATPWHNDECTFPFTGSHSPSMWVALTDVGIDNSPLRTLAGSNKDPHRYYSTFAVQGRQFPPDFRPWSELIARVNAPDADIRLWPAKAGDVLVIHPKTIHASLPRVATDNRRRLAFSLRWLGSDIRYKNNPTTRDQPYESHPGIAEGCPLPEEIFPITWRR